MPALLTLRAMTWSAVVVAVAAIAFSMPLLVLGTADAVDIVHAGGEEAMLLGGYLLAVVPCVAVLGLASLRGKRVMASLPVTIASSPLIVGLPLDLRAAAVADDVSPQKTAAVAVLSALVAASACTVVATASTAVIATVDRARERPGPVWASVVLGAIWFASSFVAHALMSPPSPSGVLLGVSLVLPLVVATLAAVASFRAPALAAHGDTNESRWAFSHVIASGVASVAAVLFVARASYALASLSGEADARSAVVCAAVDVAGAITCFVVPVVTARRG